MNVKVVCNRVYYSMIILLFLLLPTIRFPMALSIKNPVETSQNIDQNLARPTKGKSIRSINDYKSLVLNSLNTLTVNKLSANGTDFTDAIPIPLSNGTGLVAQYGSVTNYLDNISRFELFFEFNVTTSGPISITISTNVSVTNEQLTAELDDQPFALTSVASSKSGNPLQITYFVKPGTYYIHILGLQVGIVPTAYIPFTIDLALQQNTITSSNAVTNLFQSNAFVQIQNIFSFFKSTGYISNASVIDLTRGSSSFTGFDPTDSGFYKGIGLSIYGILRAGDFLSSKNNTAGLTKSNILFKYVNMTYQLFELI